MRGRRVEEMRAAVREGRRALRSERGVGGMGGAGGVGAALKMSFRVAPAVLWSSQPVAVLFIVPTIGKVLRDVEAELSVAAVWLMRVSGVFEAWMPGDAVGKLVWSLPVGLVVGALAWWLSRWWGMLVVLTVAGVAVVLVEVWAMASALYGGPGPM